MACSTSIPGSPRISRWVSGRGWNLAGKRSTPPTQCAMTYAALNLRSPTTHHSSADMLELSPRLDSCSSHCDWRADGVDERVVARGGKIVAPKTLRQVVANRPDARC